MKSRCSDVIRFRQTQADSVPSEFPSGSTRSHGSFATFQKQSCSNWTKTATRSRGPTSPRKSRRLFPAVLLSSKTMKGKRSERKSRDVWPNDKCMSSMFCRSVTSSDLVICSDALRSLQNALPQWHTHSTVSGDQTGLGLAHEERQARIASNGKGRASNEDGAVSGQAGNEQDGKYGILLYAGEVRLMVLFCRSFRLLRFAGSCSCCCFHDSGCRDQG